MKKKAAILVDVAFFLKRYRSIKKINPKSIDPKRTANGLYTMCLKHLRQKDDTVAKSLY